MDTNTQMIDFFIKMRCKESNIKIMDKQENISFSKMCKPNLFRVDLPIEADIYPEMFEGLILPFNEKEYDNINVYCHVDTKSDAVTRRTYYVVTFHVFENE